MKYSTDKSPPVELEQDASHNKISQQKLNQQHCRTLQEAADFLLELRNFSQEHKYNYLRKLIESMVIEIFEKLHIVDSRYSMISQTETEENYTSLLTVRERECLNWCSLGKTTREIATALDIPEQIINIYFDEIRKKFGATTNAHCVAIAIRKGII